MSRGFGPLALWAKYLVLLDKHPLVTKVVTSASINGTGDILGQTLFARDEPFDWKRFAKFTFLGGAFVAPVLGVWYTALNKFIPGSSAAGAVARTALDQGFFAPIFVSSFIAALLTLDGTPELIPAKLQQDLYPTVRANWSLWIPAQFLNFRFVPPHLTLLCSNMTALVWSTYLSWAATQKVGEPTSPGELEGKKAAPSRKSRVQA